MSKKSIIVWIIGFIILILLYILSATNLILKDEKRPVYQVLFLLKDNNEIYTNMKKGIEKAASEYNVDANIVSLYSTNNKKKQTELIKESKSNAYNAIVLEPYIDSLWEENYDIPFVIIGDEKYNFKHSSLKLDYKKADIDLVRNIKLKHNKIDRVILFLYGLDYYSNKITYETIKNEFERDKIYVNLINYKYNEKNLEQNIKRLVNNKDEKTILIAGDRSSFLDVTKILAANSTYNKYIEGLYGVGHTTYLLNKLDEGVISGLMAWDDYSVGYLSLSLAVRMSNKEILSDDYILEAKFIDRLNLTDKSNMRFLYPIE